MPFLGADTGQLRDLSSRMRGSILELQQRQMEISRAVAMTRWDGPDAEQFRSRVMTEVTPKLQTAQDSLQRMSGELGDHASEQDDASDPRDVWQKLDDLLHWPAEITRTIRNGQKILTDIPKMLGYLRDGADGLHRLWDFARLLPRFPGLALSEYKAIAKEWDTALNGKGWEKLGNFIPQKLSKYLDINIPGKEWAGQALRHLDEITDATKPWIAAGSKTLGKLVPGIDIGLGVHQIATGDGYDKVSGGLSVASGALVLAAPLAGPAAPIVAGIGVGLGVVSAGMDIGRAAYENIPLVRDTVDGAVNAVKDGMQNLGDGLKSIGDGFASVFG